MTFYSRQAQSDADRRAMILRATLGLRSSSSLERLGSSLTLLGEALKPAPAKKARAPRKPRLRPDQVISQGVMG